MDEAVRTTEPVRWLLERTPGGDIAVTAIVVIAVALMVVVASRGQPWAGPAAAVAVIAALGVLSALDIASATVSVIIMVLALLAGIAAFRVAKVR